MYIFNLKGLIEHLSSNKPTQRESFQYILGWIVVGFISRSAELLKADSSGSDLNFFIKLIVYVVMSGIMYLILKSYFSALYSRNGGDMGEYFLERAIAILFVTTNRTLFFFIPFFPLLLVFKYVFPDRSAMAFIAMALIIAVLAAIAYVIITSLDAMEKVRNNWKNQATQQSL